MGTVRIRVVPCNPSSEWVPSKEYVVGSPVNGTIPGKSDGIPFSDFDSSATLKHLLP